MSVANDFIAWADANVQFIRDAIGASIADEYADPQPPAALRSEWAEWNWGSALRLKEDVGNHVARLRSIHSRVSQDEVFIVHGHAEGLKEEVALYITHLGLCPIVLHELPNAGRTIIEKFSDAASSTSYAVVLATGDDEGRRKYDPELPLQPRARQNVILELGFFAGKLGRDKVAVLREADVELPSDFDGVLYITADSTGTWKNTLEQELRAAALL